MVLILGLFILICVKYIIFSYISVFSDILTFVWHVCGAMESTNDHSMA